MAMSCHPNDDPTSKSFDLSYKALAMLTAVGTVQEVTVAPLTQPPRQRRQASGKKSNGYLCLGWYSGWGIVSFVVMLMILIASSRVRPTVYKLLTNHCELTGSRAADTAISQKENNTKSFSKIQLSPVTAQVLMHHLRNALQRVAITPTTVAQPPPPSSDWQQGRDWSEWFVSSDTNARATTTQQQWSDKSSWKATTEPCLAGLQPTAPTFGGGPTCSSAGERLRRVVIPSCCNLAQPTNRQQCTKP